MHCSTNCDNMNDAAYNQMATNGSFARDRRVMQSRNSVNSGIGYQQPLLHLSNTNGRRRRHESEIELSSRQSYRPPEASVPTVTGSNIRKHARPFDLQRDRVNLTQQNPAKDLSIGICSHGFCCIQCVRTQEIGIVENCGAFEEIVGPGLYCGPSPCSCIVGRLSLRVQQVDMKVESKSRDDAFLCLSISIQFRVIVQYAYDAYYSLHDVTRQIQTYVFDVVRATIPQMTLDQIFASKSKISDTVFSRLQCVMKVYGYEIVSTLLGKICPNKIVKYSMNEINVSKRMKEAAPHRAEGERIAKVKEAEARAETLYLQGLGTSKKRAAIAQGLKNSLRENDKEQSNQDVVEVLLLAQYFDTLVAVGADRMFIRTGVADFVDR